MVSNKTINRFFLINDIFVQNPKLKKILLVAIQDNIASKILESLSCNIGEQKIRISMITTCFADEYGIKIMRAAEAIQVLAYGAGVRNEILNKLIEDAKDTEKKEINANYDLFISDLKINENKIIQKQNNFTQTKKPSTHNSQSVVTQEQILTNQEYPKHQIQPDLINHIQQLQQIDSTHDVHKKIKNAIFKQNKKTHFSKICMYLIYRILWIIHFILDILIIPFILINVLIFAIMVIHAIIIILDPSVAWNAVILRILIYTTISICILPPRILTIDIYGSSVDKMGSWLWNLQYKLK